MFDNTPIVSCAQELTAQDWNVNIMHFLPLSFTLFLLVQDVKALETEEILGILQVLIELLNCTSISNVFPPNSDEDSLMPTNGDLSDFSACVSDCF